MDAPVLDLGISGAEVEQLVFDEERDDLSEANSLLLPVGEPGHVLALDQRLAGGGYPVFIAICHCLDCKKASGREGAPYFGVPEDDFTLISGAPKAFHYIADSGKGLDRNFCPNCGARVFTNNLESFPGTVFVQIGSLDNPKGIDPLLEMFTKRRLEWEKPLDLPQFENMPS